MEKERPDIGYNIVIMDFDDTLYHDGCISPAAKAEIERARQAGVIVGILSGSSKGSLYDKLRQEISQEELDFIGASNGAVFIEADGIVEIVRQEQLASLEPVKEDFLTYSQYGKYVDTGYSVGLITSDEAVKQEVSQMIQEKYQDTGIIPSCWATGVSAVLITKHDALARYCEHCGIEARALVIGDSENDIPLFEYAAETGGIAAVVGNSELEHPLISYRASLPYGDGVAEIIRRFI